MNFVEQVNVLNGNRYLVTDTGVADNSDKVTADFSSYLKKSSQDIKYEDIFNEVSQTTGVSVDLLKAVAQAESGCRSDAVSSCGAIGVMQLMPSTAKAYGVTNPYDAYENILGGAKLLSDLLEKYNGNVTLSLAAYNAGSGNVSKYGGVPPFKETVNYISKINKLLYNALDNDSTTIEGSEPTKGLETNSIASDTVYINESDKTLEQSAVKNTSGFLSVPFLEGLYSEDISETELTEDIDYSDVSAQRMREAVISDNDEENGEDKKNINNIDASWVSSFVMPATAHAIDNILKSSPQSLYEAQAYAVSPLIAQLKDI